MQVWYLNTWFRRSARTVSAFHLVGVHDNVSMNRQLAGGNTLCWLFPEANASAGVCVQCCIGRTLPGPLAGIMPEADACARVLASSSLLLLPTRANRPAHTGSHHMIVSQANCILILMPPDKHHGHTSQCPESNAKHAAGNMSVAEARRSVLHAGSQQPP